MSKALNGSLAADSQDCRIWGDTTFCLGQSVGGFGQGRLTKNKLDNTHLPGQLIIIWAQCLKDQILELANGGVRRCMDSGDFPT